MSATSETGLEAIALFESLTSDELKSINQRCRWHRYNAHEVILERDSENRDVFFVIDGTVRVVNYSISGREIAFANVHAGSYFGELSAIDGRPRSASVVAATACRLAALSPEIFRRLVKDHAVLAEQVMMRLAAIVRSCDERIMDLSTLRAVNRVYAEIVRLAEPDIVAPANFVVRPMRTHSEIASRISTTRETVARVLGHLASDGVVERKGKTLYIRDMTRLQQLAAGGEELERDLAR